jgi:hypothetical protein
MGSGAMIYIPAFIKIGAGIRKLIRGDTQIHRKHGDLIRQLLFFQNKESALKLILSYNAGSSDLVEY